eukprot:CAMPEP_0167792066 /NCGR_PEP_ID=MMETSP0111_2-20121227/12344_1 /TAXON_ID=91324 /ORGANISM="Lotharella globosa, Strain CCCM811" /LENGTH=196 /DNA_ID=CAMNT_0007684923 /DNA_START=186 /DNA_END=776 /DNA_ORIENTATION=-
MPASHVLSSLLGQSAAWRTSTPSPAVSFPFALRDYAGAVARRHGDVDDRGALVLSLLHRATCLQEPAEVTYLLLKLPDSPLIFLGKSLRLQRSLTLRAFDAFGSVSLPVQQLLVQALHVLFPDANGFKVFRQSLLAFLRKCQILVRFAQRYLSLAIRISESLELRLLAFHLRSLRLLCIFQQSPKVSSLRLELLRQ